MIQLQWRNNDMCTTSPNIMYVFDVADPFSDTQPDDETWPPFYAFAVTENPLGVCGNAPVELLYSCCVQSLDLTVSDNYQSGAALEPAGNESQNPTDYYASGGTYCAVSGESSSNLGYQAIFILDDNDCASHFKCSANQLSIYPELHCKGEPTIYDIYENSVPIEDLTYGALSIRLIQGTKEHIQISWVSLLPSTNQVPNTSSVWDYLQHICSAISLIGGIGISSYVYFAKVRKSHTSYMKLLLLTTVIWIIHDVLNIIYAYAKFPSIEFQYIFIEILWIFHNLATGFNVYQTTVFLFLVKIPRPKKKTKKIVIVILVLLHLVFAGSNFFGYCWNANAAICIPYTFLQSWLALYQYWILIMFLWNTIPTTYIVIMFFYTSTASWKSSTKELYNSDKFFLFLLLQQFCIGVLYFSVSFLQTSTIILGTDRAWNTSLGIQMCLITLHSITNIILLQRMGKIVKGSNATDTTSNANASRRQIIVSQFESKTFDPKEGGDGLHAKKLNVFQ
ncbi:hypothetical protein HDV02_005870 [Globomyces sp. JEL0801]|nr:hypothetical protein HDV02_005870 [Globomyces sp. JEL0801]